VCGATSTMENVVWEREKRDAGGVAGNRWSKPRWR
jgi:hypothetical protein